MAIANLRRYGTRTMLTGVGLALAISVALFVNIIALSFESGTAEVYRYIKTLQNGIANVWITPSSGFELDRTTGFFTTGATLPEAKADQLLQMAEGIKVVSARFPETVAIPITIYGRSDRQTVSFSTAAATALKVKPGDTLKLKAESIRVDEVGKTPDIGAGGLVELPLPVAQKILDMPRAISWLMLKSQDVKALSQSLTTRQNMLITTEPTAKDADKAIAYLLEDKLGRGDIVTFDIKMAAIYFNRASSTLLGWLAKITLALGFVLMLSSALLSLEERRREFGIFTAVGVSSDVLYLFLLESLILFVASTLLGIFIGIILLHILVPTLFSWGVILKSVALVICYLPPMIIFGSLIPAQQLLKKSPLELLRTATA